MGILVLLRHGESVWNAEGLFTGWVDVGLSGQGLDEAKRAGALLAPGLGSPRAPRVGGGGVRAAGGNAPARLRARVTAGMIEEVAALHAAGVPWERLDYYGLEYRFIAAHLQGRLNKNDMTQKLASAIHDFAKRQETWFRRMERQGVKIHWLEGAREPLSGALTMIGADLRRDGNRRRNL